MMTFFLHDSLDTGDEIQPRDTGYPTPGFAAASRDDIHILWEKLAIPAVGGTIERPRLTELLFKSAASFNATLISGRVGTGKTASAAEFARNYERVAWYCVESTDEDWKVFSNYFAASILGHEKFSAKSNWAVGDTNPSSISQYIDSLIGEADFDDDATPTLIVLDNLHHVFDSRWFPDFFQLLIASLPEHVHPLLLCRSKPPNPIWRMRSKQVLCVIDEKLLAFNAAETIALFKTNGLTEKQARKAHEESYGRISNLAAIVERLSKI
jgi:LuxR family maltose regulon positive regulatory protein